MADLVDVRIEDQRWTKLGLAGLAQQTCAATLSYFDHDSLGFEISLLGCDDQEISQLNKEFRGKPQPTNVLSWPGQELAAGQAGESPNSPVKRGADPLELGDIAIAYSTCEDEARSAGKPLALHVSHLLVHATLHLLGYDHIVKEDAELMEEIERQVLASLGHPDPYSEEQ